MITIRTGKTITTMIKYKVSNFYTTVFILKCHAYIFFPLEKIIIENMMPTYRAFGCMIITYYHGGQSNWAVIKLKYYTVERINFFHIKIITQKINSGKRKKMMRSRRGV